MSMKFLKTVAGAAVSSLWEKVSGNVVTKDTSANVGIGVTPEAWEAAHQSIQLGPASAIWCYTGSPTDTTATYLGNNAYYDGAYKRIIAAPGSVILQDSAGNIVSKVFVSGSADSAITFIDTQTIDVSGNITVNTGNLVVGTAGKGIDFSAQTATTTGTTTAEVLNHYETGTWTGVITDQTNDCTMNNSAGAYTRVGNLVTVTGYFKTSSLGSATGALSLKGLPFTPASNLRNYASIDIGHARNLNITAGYSMGGNIQVNTDYYFLYLWSATTGTAAITDTEWTDDGGIMITGSYMVS